MWLISRTTTAEGFVTETEYDKNENVILKKVYGKNDVPAVTRTDYDLLGRAIKEVTPNFYNSALESTDCL
jgi:YD repeat-containing protein